MRSARIRHQIARFRITIRLRTRFSSVLGCALLLSACGDCGSISGEVKGVSKGERPAKSGTVVAGTVRLAPGHPLPAYTYADLERKVLDHTARGKWPDGCSPPKRTDLTPVTLSPDGSLVGVMVAATEFGNVDPRPPKVHEVAIEDCRLTPPLVVAVKGDVMRIKNNVKFPFMPTFGPTTIARTLSPGQTFEVNLERGGVDAVLCSFTAPCGRTDVVTIYHPVYAVTGSDGRFRIEDFPADRDVELNVWHPLFESTKIPLKVGLGETKEVEVQLTPKPRFAGGGGKPAAQEDAGTPAGVTAGTAVGTDKSE